jgi:hypothetical protein
LEQQIKQLDQQVLDWKAKCDAIEKRENERRTLDEKKHAEEVAFLKKTNVQLKASSQTAFFLLDNSYLNVFDFVDINRLIIYFFD